MLSTEKMWCLIPLIIYPKGRKCAYVLLLDRQQEELPASMERPEDDQPW